MLQPELVSQVKRLPVKAKEITPQLGIPTHQVIPTLFKEWIQITMAAYSIRSTQSCTFFLKIVYIHCIFKCLFDC